MTIRQNDMLWGGLITAIFLPVYFFVLPAEVPVHTPVKVPALSPDFWPQLMVEGLVLLGLVQIVTGFIHKVSADMPKLSQENTWRVAGVCALLVIYPLCIQFLGFFVSSVVCLFLCMLVFGERKVSGLLICSLAVPALLQLFFVKVAAVIIPTGIFPF